MDDIIVIISGGLGAEWASWEWKTGRGAVEEKGGIPPPVKRHHGKQKQ